MSPDDLLMLAAEEYWNGSTSSSDRMFCTLTSEEKNRVATAMKPALRAFLRNINSIAYGGGDEMVALWWQYQDFLEVKDA